MRYSQTPFDAHGSSYVRYTHSGKRATLYNVAKMLGHSNTNMTRHYARILDSSIMRDMQTVAKAMDL